MTYMKTVVLADICNFEKGTTGLAKAVPGKYPLVATGADRRSCDSFQFDTKAVCIPLVSSTGHGHASLKNVHYQEGKFALGSILVALTVRDESVLDIQFLHLYLPSIGRQREIVKKFKSVVVEGIELNSELTHQQAFNCIGESSITMPNRS